MLRLSRPLVTVTHQSQETDISSASLHRQAAAEKEGCRAELWLTFDAHNSVGFPLEVCWKITEGRHQDCGEFGVR